MAGLGFKDFAVGEVLTSADVDGYLMQQTVMRFADSAARGSALGTATGTAVPLAEGMVSYLDDTNTVQVYSGSAWVGIGNFTALAVITATDASWPVPTLADPVIRVVVVGGGGGGGGNRTGTDGSAGTQSSFVCSAGTAIAAGGAGGQRCEGGVGAQAQDGFISGNGGAGATDVSDETGMTGYGGAVTVAYFDASGDSTFNISIGSGGAGGTGGGRDGGDGVVLVEYRAG